MLKSLNLIGFYVKDVNASTSFYKTLGFELVNNDGSFAEMKLGNMRVTFTAQETAKDKDESFQKDAFGEPKGTGIYLNVEVEHIDDYYKYLTDNNITPSTQPRDWPWGNREFVVRDPDRYKLVMYEKVKG